MGLTELSSISFIFLSLPAAINVFMSGVAATALQQAERLCSADSMLPATTIGSYLHTDQLPAPS
jgi:hypothetical protein